MNYSGSKKKWNDEITRNSAIADKLRDAKFSYPLYFAPQLKEFTWELGIGAHGQKKLESWGYRAEKKFDDIFSRLDTIHQRDGQTDTGQQQRPRLRIASRGKKMSRVE